MSTAAETVTEWQAHALAWENSELPQKAYCQQKELSYKRFVYERGLLMKRRRSNTRHFLAVKKPMDRATTEASAEKYSSSAGFVLRCPNGYQLAIPVQADAKTLNQLLSFIGAVVC